jgi:hypothetical protein
VADPAAVAVVADSQTLDCPAVDSPVAVANPVAVDSPVVADNPEDPANPVDRPSPVDPANPVDRPSPVDPANPEDPASPVDRPNPDSPVGRHSRDNPVNRLNPDSPKNLQLAYRAKVSRRISSHPDSSHPISLIHPRSHIQKDHQGRNRNLPRHLARTKLQHSVRTGCFMRVGRGLRNKSWVVRGKTMNNKGLRQQNTWRSCARE